MTRVVGSSGATYVLDSAPTFIGGQALLYRAIADDDDRVLAIKVSQEPGVDGAWLLGEGEQLVRLAADPVVGPLVVPVWDTGAWEDRPFVVMEWFPYTLDQWCAGRPMGARLAALRVFLSAVAQLHSAVPPVVHGDLKPGNVLVRDDGGDPVFALADFGGSTVGGFTPLYTPPEQRAGSGPDPAWDRWACAATVWTCITGAAPNGPDAGDRAAFELALPRSRLLQRELSRHLLHRADQRPADLRQIAARLVEPPSRVVGRSATLGGLLVVGVAAGIAAAMSLASPSHAGCPGGFAPDATLGLGGCSAPDGRRVVHVPAGRFRMGGVVDDGAFTADAVAHEVVLTRAFWMGVTEVTQGEWAAVMDDDPLGRSLDVGGVAKCDTWEGRSLRGADLPVVCVSWRDAVAFANARSEADGLAIAYAFTGNTVLWDGDAAGWRLPTEAEWEWAARGGGAGPWAGAAIRDDLCDYANLRDASAPESWGGELPCSDHAPILAPVGRYRPNGFGLRDMLGNAAEAVWDGYGRYPTTTVHDPTGTAGDALRVRRGASWNHVAKGVAARYADEPDAWGNVTGFRLVRTVP